MISIANDALAVDYVINAAQMLPSTVTAPMAMNPIVDGSNATAHAKPLQLQLPLNPAKLLRHQESQPSAHSSMQFRTARSARSRSQQTEQSGATHSTLTPSQAVLYAARHTPSSSWPRSGSHESHDIGSARWVQHVARLSSQGQKAKPSSKLSMGSKVMAKVKHWLSFGRKQPVEVAIAGLAQISNHDEEEEKKEKEKQSHSVHQHAPSLASSAAAVAPLPGAVQQSQKESPYPSLSFYGFEPVRGDIVEDPILVNPSCAKAPCPQACYCYQCFDQPYQQDVMLVHA